MSEPVRPGSTFSADDALPPVEPPSAGFIIQLFVIPGVIVTIIVMVWLMFNWLAQKGNDPQSFVRALSQNNESRWHAAVNLANALRGSRDDSPDSLKNNVELDRQLAAILDEELKAGSTQSNPLMLRMYLCRALGEFHVNDALPVLLKSIETNHDPGESDVRRAALEAVALLAQNAPPPGEEIEQRRQDVLLAASRDDDSKVRSAAAYTLGVMPGEQWETRLHALLSDPYPDVRFNAATGLARHGDPASVAVLCEMLDPAETAGLDVEKDDDSVRAYKRAMIVVNGLRASRQFVKEASAKSATGDADALAQLTTAAHRLEESKFGKEMSNDQIGIELEELLQELPVEKSPQAPN